MLENPNNGDPSDHPNENRKDDRGIEGSPHGRTGSDLWQWHGRGSQAWRLK